MKLSKFSNNFRFSSIFIKIISKLSFFHDSSEKSRHLWQIAPSFNAGKIQNFGNTDFRNIPMYFLTFQSQFNFKQRSEKLWQEIYVRRQRRNLLEFGRGRIDHNFIELHAPTLTFSWFQGSPQWIEILFKDAREVRNLEFQFQGGFVGQKCVLQFYKEQPANDSSPDVELNNFYPEDINGVQTYNLPSPVCAKFIRILFNESTDFYGRVTVYQLKIL